MAFVAALRRATRPELRRLGPPPCRRLLGGLAPATQQLVDSLQTVKLNNGLTMRYCDTAPGDASKPLVVLMHGWPESWFSWRHQLASLDAAGYRAVAPDLRGFGGTDAPADTADYGVAKRTGDMKALLDHLETDDAAFVGHDHGAFTGWLLAQLEPAIVRCYYALSVPVRAKRRAKRAPVAPLWLMRKTAYGDETRKTSVYGWGHLYPWAPQPTKFFYILHHHLPHAASDYAEDARAAQMALQFGDRAEVDYVVDEYERNGWEGGLHWYKTMDPDWEATPQLKGDGRKLKVPAGFLAGTEDLVVDMFGGVEKITADLKATCAANDPPITFLEGGGHWIQQERPGDVNEKLLEFLAEYN
ncbi:10-hydroxy-9-(phosphonooxy)octadecanoate phosphatase [Aureococcus anophagefferens]|nr:10-hydroxy-9-(phosphonooxy)octadecanoate phosphatase [Aureococcus anophagefferens]